MRAAGRVAAASMADSSARGTDTNRRQACRGAGGRMRLRAHAGLDTSLCNDEKSHRAHRSWQRSERHSIGHAHAFVACVWPWRCGFARTEGSRRRHAGGLAVVLLLVFFLTWALRSVGSVAQRSYRIDFQRIKFCRTIFENTLLCSDRLTDPLHTWI